MSALHKNLITAHTHLLVAPTMDGNLFGMAAPAPMVLPAPIAKAAAATATAARHVGMMLVAPLIGLVFAVGLPIIGLAVLAWMARADLARYAVKIARFGKNTLLFIAAPFVGLAYVIAMPFVGVAVLGWMGGRALMNS